MGRRSAYRIKVKSGEGTGDDDEDDDEENGSGNDDDDDGDDALSLFFRTFFRNRLWFRFLYRSISRHARNTKGKTKLQGLQWRRGFT